MKQRSVPGSLICFTLVLILTGSPTPTLAQVIQTDSAALSPSQPPKKEIGRLQTALKRDVGTIEMAESLLTLARRLDYLPGQVVALCQLAGIRFRQQQPQEATALLQEAGKIAGQIQGMSEAGWAMDQVGRRMQGRDARRMPTFMNALGPVLDSLGAALNNSALMMKRKGAGAMPIEETPSAPPTEKRRNGRRLSQDNYADYLSSRPILPDEPTLNRYFRLKPDVIDRWVDTLINSVDNTPQVARQLTARKKRRDSSQALSKAFAKEGDYAKAYQYYLQYSAYKDSLNAEATTRRLASLEYKQNLLKKEAQIQLLTKDRQLSEQASNRQRQYVFALIGGMALLGAFSLVLTRNNRAKQLANRQLSEQKEALQQTLAELKTTQTQLVQAEKMASLGELTAGIAHEIQNPLNFVNNFSEVSAELVSELMEHRQNVRRDEELVDELLSDVQQNLQKISQHGGRASAIVKGMLEHARKGGGEKRLTDLNALTEEYLKLAYHGIRRSGWSDCRTTPGAAPAKDKSFEAKLTTVLAPDLGQVTIAPQEVGRVLMNVFNNAFYAVQKRQQSAGPDYQPEVVVSTSQENNQIRVKIRDNGTGIPASIRQKIFQPFFTTKPTGQGTGLGFSLSYDIITKGHGGTLTIESEEGEFTELTLTLPAAV